MADSLPLGKAVGSAPIPIVLHIARQKTGPKVGQKSALSDDVKLKLAQHISSEFDTRHVLLISGKRGKNHVVDEMLVLKTNISFHHRLPRQLSANGSSNALRSVLSGRLNFLLRKRMAVPRKVVRTTCQMIHTNWPGCS